MLLASLSRQTSRVTKLLQLHREMHPRKRPVVSRGYNGQASLLTAATVWTSEMLLLVLAPSTTSRLYIAICVRVTVQLTDCASTFHKIPSNPYLSKT